MCLVCDRARDSLPRSTHHRPMYDPAHSVLQVVLNDFFLFIILLNYQLRFFLPILDFYVLSTDCNVYDPQHLPQSLHHLRPDRTPGISMLGLRPGSRLDGERFHLAPGERQLDRGRRGAPVLLVDGRVSLHEQ